MLPRIWIALLALLLLAAPAGGAFAEAADAQSSAAALPDDDALAQPRVLPAERTPDRTASTAKLDHAVPPAPVLARVFRPPRPSFA